MNDKRPINLDLRTIKLPITAVVSILHRVSGVFLVAAVAVLLYCLDVSLRSEESFNAIKAIMGSWWFKGIVWIIWVALIYHSAAGIRHLVMDAGVGESLEGGRSGARLVLIATVLLALLMGAWLLW